VGIGLESTIVDFTEEIPTILRPGYITQDMIARVIGEVRMDKGLIAENSGIRPKAPGMKYKHYAPKGDLVIIEGDPQTVTDYINEQVDIMAQAGMRCGVIATEESRAAYRADCVLCIGSRKDENSIARHLYDVLRKFDDLKVDKIYSESFGTPVMGQAIMNRLLKAAGHQVIQV
jgi:L-threonylcarbamoyladenylate synthase